MNAVMRAGGPAAAGSFRQIELRRGGKIAGTFDLYDLLLRGDRAGDRLVQPDDVIHVAAVGPQVALRGSVNKQAIYELKAGETLRDLLAMAAGFSPVADKSRVALERLDNRNAQRVVQIELPANDAAPLVNGDVVRVFSAVEATLSIKRQNKRVRVDGEVLNPGEYVLPPESTLTDALKAAGGLTPAAYLYAAQFMRESVKQTQQENFDRALRDLETESARVTFSTRTTNADEAAAQTANAQATSRLIERMRAVKPTGRIVLQTPPEGGELPALALEDGDHLYIPARPTTVGIFGSVFNTGSYLYSSGRQVTDYLRLAGGPTRGADDASIFVVRANGSVVSSMQGSGWFNRLGQLSALKAEPGDTIFVPEEMNKTTNLQTARDWTQIFFQLAVGLAGLKTATGF
jgi:protein involved in polysaccharide export with SLBB domain